MATIKLKLNPDDLRVESFTPVAGEGGRGTVQAFDGDPAQTRDRYTCLCNPTTVCLDSIDYETCNYTACGNNTCTCPPLTGPTCDENSCVPTRCDFTCDIFCA